ncbi:hypothetical protein BZM27_44465 [Paraburkholderia steynii]|uniref:Uncharacterized protein n=1 Tax=Paraburkholderia steynii TaxID=1245441 RepID=A0A4R0X1M2_9BURK|nr:hypothetical protein BZM27_44465 [Paraburkholderia steynii]
MASVGRSLRNMVQDWLAPDPKRGFRVSHVGRSGHGRYVCVVADNGAGSRAMFFFRHRDGSWCIFPPQPERPAMQVAGSCVEHESVNQ